MTWLKQVLPMATFCAVIGLLWLAWDHFRDEPQVTASTAAPEHAKPAKTSYPVDESTLNVVELTAEAVRRVGIEVHPIELRSMPRSRPYGAEVLLPTGAAVTVSAPLAGTLGTAGNRPFPIVGQQVRTGEALLELLPLLTPERSVLTPSERIRSAEARATLAQTQIDADGQLQQTIVQVEAAQIALARAERLLQDSVGTQRAVDEARAQLELAEKARAAAQNRKQLVDSIELDEQAGTLTSLSIATPLGGIVRVTHVQSGQLIAAGLPLFEVMNDEVMWIKVPVYVGELNEIEASRPVRLTLLDGRQSADDVIGKPVTLPPTALPLSAAVDLYYEVANMDHRFRPGQKLAAHLPLKGETNMNAVVWSAVVHDIYGNQWVYEQIEERRYARRRVEVGWLDDGWAALIRGPAAGAVIVTAGAAELAGTEFGFSK